MSGLFISSRSTIDNYCGRGHFSAVSWCYEGSHYRVIIYSEIDSPLPILPPPSRPPGFRNLTYFLITCMWGVLAPHIPLQLMSYYSGPQGEILQSLIFNWKPDCLTSVSLRVHIYQKSVITARCRREEGGDGGGDNVTLYYNTKVTMPQCLALLMVNKNFPFPRSSQSI